MTERRSTALIIIMVILMAIAAYAAGYLTKALIDSRAPALQPVPTRDAITSEQFDVFWEAWDKVENNYLGELPNEQALTYGAIRGSVHELGDPYTIFLEPVVREEEKLSLRGNFGGIGVSLTRQEDGLIVLEPIPGNPAERAGILSGDILLALDGAEISAEEDVSAIAARIRGEKGTSVTLTVIHLDGAESVDIEVEREDILIPSVSSRLLREDERIGYIKLTRFSGESSGEVELALLTLLEIGAKSIVLDLRGNGGGLLDAAVFVSDHFLEEKVVYHQLTRTEGETTELTERKTTLPDQPLVVLIDGGTASSAEIVAGALQDHERAVLIGERTFGKGSVQLVYDLSDGSSIHVTWARWLTPERREIDQNGLGPNFEVIPSPEALADGRDEPLERAIEYLQTEQ